MGALRRIGFLLVALISAPASASSIRIEPPFWWSGMNDSRLQLVLEAPGIADAEVELVKGTASLVRQTRGDSDNYLFVDLDLRDAPPQELKLRVRQDGRNTFLRYRLSARADGSAQRVGFGPKDLIYLLVPDRFANGDPKNDVVAGLAESRVDRSDPNARHGGDIQGIISKLDYLSDLGVTQIWPTPLIENNSAQFSYHGYGATDFYRIDPRFGSNDDYRRLSREASRRGIGLIQDIVLNHIGSNHRWMRDPPTKDWFGSDGQFEPTNHARTSLQDPYAADVDRRVFQGGWFTESMPDLNQRQPLLATYLIQMSLWWIEYAELSGIREDTYPYADPAFLANWGRRIAAEYPNFNIVGEEWSANPVVVSYWQKGNARGANSSTPSMMDFPMYYELLAALTGAEAWDGGWIRLYQAKVNDVLYPDPNNLVLFDGNHDTPRLYSLLKEDLQAYKMAIAYLMTTKRIPQLFYGTEVLLTSPTVRDDGAVRSDFPGGWRDDSVDAVSGKNLSADAREAQTFVRRLANFRRQSPALHRGRLTHYFPTSGVYVYFRHDADTVVMVAINKSSEPQVIELGRFAEVLPPASVARDVISDEVTSFGDTLTLAPRSSNVYSIKR